MGFHDSGFINFLNKLCVYGILPAVYWCAKGYFNYFNWVVLIKDFAFKNVSLGYYLVLCLLIGQYDLHIAVAYNSYYHCF